MVHENRLFAVRNADVRGSIPLVHQLNQRLRAGHRFAVFASVATTLPNFVFGCNDRHFHHSHFTSSDAPASDAPKALSTYFHRSAFRFIRRSVYRAVIRMSL